MMIQPIYIFLDFEGTICEHGAGIPRENFGGMQLVADLQSAGHTIVLNTSRCIQAEELKKALDFVNLHPNVSISFPITSHPHKRYPESFFKEGVVNICREVVKKGGEIVDVLYLDDMAANIPLKKCVNSDRDMVDWDRVRPILKAAGLLL